MAGRAVNLLFLILGSCLYSVQCQEPCILLLKDYLKTPVFRPLVYTEEGILQKSQNYQIKIPHGQVALFSCQNNFFKAYPERHNLTAKCDDDTLIVQHDSSKLQFKGLNCDLRPIEEGKHAVNECPNSSKGSYLQFYDGKEAAYNVLAEVCYNYDVEQATFIRVQLPYEAEPRTLHTEELKSNVNIPHKIAMLSAYRADKTDINLKRLLTDEFNFAHQGVVAVKLLPKLFFNDQLYEIEKFETNFVGLWTTVATGNWKQLLDDIHEYTKEKKKPHEVILGTHGTLSLATPGGKEVDINLIEDKVPMPHYVWAIVHNKQKKQAVAIVTINNPFVTVDDIKKDMFCDNQCEKISWLRRILKNKKYARPIYGYTFCCSLDSFRIFSSLGSTTLLKD